MKQKQYPPGIANIISNEAAERFSYYGMRCLLVIYMTRYLVGAGGELDLMSDEEAKGWFHLFVTANYFFPFIGALISDIFWGKYVTIFRLSLLYCLGHGVLAVSADRLGLAIGLTFIAMGSGGIKPCVSAHVGDQFDTSRRHLIEPVFSIFYFAINLGAFVSTLLTPYLLDRFGPHVAFGVPGLFMLLATWVFWLGRKKFVAIPPVGWKKFRSEVFSAEGRHALASLCGLYLFIAVFWSLFDQMGSSWVLQAQKMQRLIDLNGFGTDISWLRFEILPAQLQALNPVLILLLIPVFLKVIYPAMNRVYPLTPLRKMAIGMVVASASFAVVGLAETRLQQGMEVSIMWQVVAYILLTAAEVMVSITSLEFSYTQAPNAMKSLVMGLYFLSVSLGNFVAALVNFLILKTGLEAYLGGANYFYFFALFMLVTAACFGVYIRSYKERYHLQREVMPPLDPAG